MSERRICKYCGMELSEDVPHGLRQCHLHAVARIAELEAEHRWIPVSERLPEATEYVYAVVYDAIDNTSKVSMLKHYGDGNWFSWESERYVVTHWMPLPELPEVK